MDGLTDDGNGWAAAGEAAPAGADGLAAQRIRLFGAAYRMLGSARGAEEVVREAVAGPARPGPGAPGDPYARLVREVVGAALRHGEGARHHGEGARHHGEAVRGRREARAGPWLPEPVLTEDGVLGRLESAEERESVSMARLVLLERLPPAERAAYVLHEVFGYGPAETAAVLGLPEARCLAMRRRARQRVRESEGAPRAEDSRERRWLVVTELLRAAAEQDQPALEELLADDVVAWSDGGGQPGVARRPVLGARKVGRFLAGLAVKVPVRTEECVAEVNGEAAVVATAGDEVVGVLVPEFGAQGLVGIRMVSDPARLVYSSRQWAARGAEGGGRRAVGMSGP